MALECKKCMLKPICRNKPYMQMFEDCSLVRGYLSFHSIACFQRDNKLIDIYRALQPTTWFVVEAKYPIHSYGSQYEDAIGEGTMYMVEEVGKEKYPGNRRVE